MRPDQLVTGVDPASGELHTARVVSCHSFDAPELLTFTTATGEMVKSSPSHLFIAGPGDVWGTRAAAFQAGDSLMVYDNKLARAVTTNITSIQVSQVPQRVEDLRAEVAALRGVLYVGVGLAQRLMEPLEVEPGLPHRQRRRLDAMVGEEWERLVT